MASELAPTAAERKLIAAAAKGTVADYCVGDEAADDPAGGAGWGEARALRAEVIYALCVGTRTDWPVHAKGVRALGARITGALDLEDATLRCPLALRGCYVEEPLTLVDCEARSLVLNGSHIRALTADRLKTTGSVFLRHGFTAKGEVRLLGADIRGDLSCVGGTFENPGGHALSADRLKATGGVFLRDGFTAKGAVRLLGANIGGDLDCDGGTFENPGGDALSADGLKTSGGVYLRGGFTAKGAVRLVGANIGGNLECDGGTFENPDGKALSAERLKTAGSIFLRGGFTATGEVRLLGANIGGNLVCDGGTFENPDGDALHADGLKTAGDVFLRGGFTAKGEVRLLGADIGGNLECLGGTFENPDGDALSADGLKTTGSVFLRQGFIAKGAVRLHRAEIGGNLVCVGGTFENPGSDAVIAEGMNIKGGLFLRGLAVPPQGAINLRHVRVGVLIDDRASWPPAGKLVLDGFVYGSFGSFAPTDAAARLEWLRLQPAGDFRPQPYEQLVKVLRAMGLEEDARQIAIEKQREARKRLHSRWARAASRFLDETIGYGYQPWKPMLVLAALFVYGTIVYWIAANAGALCASQAPLFGGTGCHDVPAQYPAFSALFFALDVTIPFFDLHQERFWEIDPSQPGAWVFALWQRVNIALGWLFAILAAVGFSGILKKD